MTTKFEDTSVFSGVCEYLDKCGQSWRRMNEGIFWGFYKLKDDTFILEGHIRKPKQIPTTIKEVHKMYLECRKKYED